MELKTYHHPLVHSTWGVLTRFHANILDTHPYIVYTLQILCTNLSSGDILEPAQ